MSKNSQILEKVGGLEAAQVIVECAPKGATHYTNDAGLYYYKQEPFRSSVWIDDYWQSLFSDFDVCLDHHVNLSDLRTAITEHRIDTPGAPSQTHAELVLHEQIKNLNSSRNFWRLMFFAAFICYGVAWWLV